MRQRAMVFGATGFVGREVVPALLEKGVEVVAHVRPDSGRLEEWRGRFEEQGASVDETPWEEAAMAKTLAREKPDLVFCCIGTTKARERATGGAATYEAIDYGLTKLLLDACLAAEISPRFVYISAMGTSAKALGAYMEARFRAEEAIRTSGLPFIIARPPVIAGPGRDEARYLEQIGGVAMNIFAGGLSLMGAKRLGDRYRSTDNVELAKMLVKGALEAKEKGVILESEDLKY